MAYSKTTWGASTPLDPTNLNKMQTQYEEAITEAGGIRGSPSVDSRFEVVSSFPDPIEGRMIYHSGLKTHFFADGTRWLIEYVSRDGGDGTRGDFTSSGNIQYTVPALWQTVRRNYRNFTLSAGDMLTVEKPVRCLIIASWGNIVINGTINMDYVGGYQHATERYVTLFGTQIDLQGGDGGYGGGSGTGGSGGNGGRWSANVSCAGGRRGGGGGGGSTPTYVGCEGGGAGYGFNSSSTTAGGADGTVGGSWGNCDHGEVGVGGGGAVHVTDSAMGTYVKAGYSPSTSGGRAAHGGGGALRVHGVTPSQSLSAGNAPSTPENLGGGGVIILLALGNITINSGGAINARGGPGGVGGNAYSGTFSMAAYGGGGGGGSGGGRVILVRRGSYTNNGTISVAGGAGGLGGWSADGMSRSESGYTGASGSTGAWLI